MKYAPNIPAIAPDAPSIGIVDEGMRKYWTRLPKTPAKKYNSKKRNLSQPCFCVISKYP